MWFRRFVWTSVLVCSLTAGFSAGEGRARANSVVLEDVLASGISRSQKIERFEKAVVVPEDLPMIFAYIGRLDKDAEKSFAVRLYTSAETDATMRLYAGQHLILKLKNLAYLANYKRFIMDGMLGSAAIDDFLKFHRTRLTFVGEYCAIICNYGGYEKVDRDGLVDKRVLPVLAQCMAGARIPENADKEAAEAVRNSRVQLIPLAMAKLELRDAKEALFAALLSESERSFRSRCAYALARLLPREESKAKVDKVLLRDQKDWLVRYQYGIALLEKNHTSDSIDFFRIKNLDPEFKLTIFQLEKRLEALERVRSPRMRRFYKDLFKSKDFAQLFMKPHKKYHKTMAKVKCYKRILAHLKRNRINEFNQAILDLASETSIDDVRASSYAHLNLKQR